MRRIEGVDSVRTRDSPVTKRQEKVQGIKDNAGLQKPVVVKLPQVFDSSNATLVVLEDVLLEE
jgi:hypothetical protein